MIGLIWLALAQGPASAAVTSLEDLMKLTVTTATRTPEGLGGVPARMDVVTAAQIERRGYRFLTDVLKDLPDFKVDLYGDQDYPAELTVNGVRGAGKVVILLDGVRISSPTNEPLPILANYPVHSAKQIEIVYGPASALYGADAFSAVVNVISKNGDEQPGWSAGASAGQFGLSNQSFSYATPLGPGASLLVGGQVLYDRQPNLATYYPDDFAGIDALQTGVFDSIFGPMTSARPVTPRFENPQWAGSFQASLRAGGLQAVAFHSAQHASNSMPTRPNNSVYNADAYQQNELWVASASLTRDVRGVTSTSSASFSRHEMDPGSGYWNVFSNFSRGYKYAYGSMIKGEQQFGWNLTPTLAMTAGGTVEKFFAIPQTADLNEPVTARDRPGTILGTTIPDDFYTLRYYNSGVYAQAQYDVTPRVTLTGGIRGDYNTRFGGTANPRIGLVARPSASTVLKVLYGTAYLAPSPYQSYAHYGSFVSDDDGRTFRSDYWHVPNPQLQPQKKRTFETALTQRLGSAFNLSASAFYTRLFDLILSTDADRAGSGFYKGWPVSYMDFPVNEGSNTLYGSTIGIDYLEAFGGDRRVEGRAAVSLVDGHVWNDDTTADGSLQLGGMAPVQFRAVIDFDWGRWSVAPRLAIVGTQRVIATDEDDDPSRLTLPGYHTVDVTLRRRGLFKRASLFLTVENAFDARYRSINIRAYSNPEEFVGAPQNPRRVSAGITLGSGR
jgi:outer membrane cobalamin receptor